MSIIIVSCVSIQFLLNILFYGKAYFALLLCYIFEYITKNEMIK